MQQVDERQARKEYVRRRQTKVLTVSGAVLAVVMLIALLFNFHVFGLGKVSTSVAEPNFGNAAPCAVDSAEGGVGKYVSNGSVGVRVLNGTTHLQLANAVSGSLANRGFAVQTASNYSRSDVERTTIFFGKNAINEAYTLNGNFTDATMVMTTREDQLIDVVLGATFNNLKDADASPKKGDNITNIEGCQPADKMTDLTADTDHDPYVPAQ